MGINYNDSIILYNFYRNQTLRKDLYFGTRFDNVRVELTQAQDIRNTGSESADSCTVKIKNNASLPKPYCDAGIWDGQTAEEMENTFTISEKNGDFFVVVKKDSMNIHIDDLPVGVIDANDEAYGRGFFNFVKDKCDTAYKINTKAVWEVVPYFQIGGN